MAVSPIRQLLWLRWTLTKRSFRSKSALVGIILMLLVLGPYSLGFAGGLGFGLWKLPVAAGEHLLRGALLLIAGVWTLGPLLGFQLNEAHDITRLFVFPVPVRQIFIASLLGCLFDLLTLLILPSLLAAIVGAGTHGVGTALVAVLAMNLFLFQTLAASQAVTLALHGILQSRRWRDIALLIVPLFWMVWQFGMQSIGRTAGKIDWKAFLASPTWEFASFLPPGLAARAVGAAMKGLWPLSIAYVGGLSLILVATVVLAGRLVGKAHEGDEVGVPAPAPGVLQKQRPSRGYRLAGLSPVAGAIFEKEWRYFTRDPFFRLMGMNFLYMIALGVFMSFMRGNNRSGAEELAGGIQSSMGLWMGSSLLLFQQTLLFYNSFGSEANAAAMLFAFPAPRRDLLIGKNLAQLSVVLPLNLVAGLLLCVVLKRLELLPVLLPWVLFAPVLMAAVGNGVSVWLPFRVNTQGLRARQQNTGYGAGYVFLSLGISLAALVLYAPVLAAVLVPYLFLGNGWLALTVPMAAAYVIGLYILSLKVTLPWLLEREAEIVAKVARPDA